MKCFWFLPVTLSLAVGQLRQTIIDDKVDGHQSKLIETQERNLEQHFDDAKDDSALSFIDGTLDISDHEFDEADRDMFITRICQYIESLFYGQVICTCNFAVSFDVIGYSCDRFIDVEKGNIIYTPNFFGNFIIKLFSAEIAVQGGFCAKKYSVYVDDLGTYLNLGNMCVASELTVAATKVAPYLEVKVTGCQIQLGILGTCECKGCTVGGLPGVQGACVATVGGGSIIPAPCIPLGIPLFRTSEKTDVRTIMDPFNLDEAIELKVEEYRAEVVAGTANKNDKNKDEPKKGEDLSDNDLDKSDCRNGLCTKDKNGNDQSTGNTDGSGSGPQDTGNGDTAPINGGDNVGNNSPRTPVGWTIWDSIRNFLS